MSQYAPQVSPQQSPATPIFQETCITSMLQAVSTGSGIATWLQLHSLVQKMFKAFANLLEENHIVAVLKQNQVCCNSLVVKSRFLNNKLKEHFRKKNLFFQATYVNVVRDWTGNMVNYATTGGAYRKRDAKKDDRQIPHSFTFVRRDCR